ncbi:transposase IS204/IS1001/IS1096/IS1165 family protein [Paracoccus pantotrophus]|uniref:Transposase IS204/IS1001/IS1096/IS1165 family protein n=1 Tax=Paracoccus pantotrophus TaxID=82367 RepID=A0AAE6NYJ4_PARPN|nr:transposase family protein [Paracoccus pantotrophus]RKS52173.1 transposase IS204/IS1001/IS1096/IS1165 family protein [Paracoccus pantotrophus]
MPARCDAKLLPEGVRATGYRVDGAVISVDAEMIRSEAFCPGCGLRSARRHGRYVRSLADLPVHGRTVQLRLSVRRFRCLIAQCPVKTFGEAVPVSLAQPHGRRTGRFQDIVAYLGRAMGADLPRHLGVAFCCASAKTPSCEARCDRRMRRFRDRVSSALTTGRGARGGATAPRSVIPSAALSSASCRIASPRPWPPGCDVIRRSRLSREIGMAGMAGQSHKLFRTPYRSPTAGTFSRTQAMRSCPQSAARCRKSARWPIMPTSTLAS